MPLVPPELEVDVLELVLLDEDVEDVLPLPLDALVLLEDDALLELLLELDVAPELLEDEDEVALLELELLELDVPVEEEALLEPDDDSVPPLELAAVLLAEEPLADAPARGGQRRTSSPSAMQ